MGITRKTTKYDVEHGGDFNEEFVDKGIVFYEQNDGTNHSDKKVNDEDLTWTRKDDDNLGHLDVVGDINTTHDIDVGNDAFIHHNLEVDNDTDIHGYTHLIGDASQPEPTYTVLETIDISDLKTGDIIKIGDEYVVVESITYDEDTEEYTINDVEVVAKDEEITTYKKEVIDTYDILEVDHSATFHENVQIDGNTNIDGTLDVTKKTSLHDDLEVDGHITGHSGLDITGTATINGDLHVKGTAYEEHATDVYVGADLLTLRDGANTGLEDDAVSGTIINKYDGTDSLGVVAGNDGILRVGEIEIVKVYTTDDVDYYDNRDLEGDPVELPDDVKLHQIGETNPETGLKEYYYIASDDTEPIATRDINANMIDQSILKWDADGLDIVSTSTTEERVIDNEVRAKDLVPRVEDLEAGKLNLDATSKYPVVIDRTDTEEYKATSTAVLAVLAEHLTLVDKDTDSYKSDRVLFIKDDTDPDDITYTAITHYKYNATDGLTVSTDGGTTYEAVSLPLYYQTGSKESNNYHWSLTADNVIRWYDSVEEYNQAVEDGEIEQDNIVLIKNTVAMTGDIMAQDVNTTNSPLTVVDYVRRGDYNVVTSNAVAKIMNGETSEHIDDVTIKLAGATYENYGFTWQNLYNTFFDEDGQIIEEVPYVEDSDRYWPVSYATTEVIDDVSYYYFYYTMDDGATYDTVGGQAYEDGTLYKLTSVGKMYVVEKEAFKMAHPIGSVFLHTTEVGPYSADTEDPLVWTSLGTINGSLTGVTGEDVYMLRRDA